MDGQLEQILLDFIVILFLMDKKEDIFHNIGLSWTFLGFFKVKRRSAQDILISFHFSCRTENIHLSLSCLSPKTLNSLLIHSLIH